MASESDVYVFEESVEAQERKLLFKDKNWLTVNDNSSTNGSYNGQVNFDLSVLASQGHFVDLSQAYVQFPIRLRMTGTSAVSTGLTSDKTALVLKNGFYQFINSVQFELDGKTLQTPQNLENIACHYKILSEWSNEQYNKFQHVLGMSLDAYKDDFPNSAFTSFIDKNGFNLNSTTTNLGMNNRTVDVNNINTSTTLLNTILPAGATKLAGKSAVQVNNTCSAGSDVFTAFIMGTVRLKDICPIVEKMPMCRNLRGRLILNYNAFKTTIDASGNVSYQSLTAGLTNPVMLNSATFTQGSNPVTITAEISAVSSGVTTGAGSALSISSPISNCMLKVPYYIANPDVDQALSIKKHISYLDRYMTSFQVAAGASFSGTLSPGITNPRKILLVPYFNNLAKTSTNFDTQINPLVSVFDPAPGITSPFAALTNIQYTVGGESCFATPLSFDNDAWMQEVAKDGAIDGAENNKLSSGILFPSHFSFSYRYYVTDISRMTKADDGSSKSIQVSLYNPTACNMTIYAFIYSERQCTVDTALGKVSQ